MVKLQRFIDRFFGFFLVSFLFLFRIFDRKPTQKRRFLIIKLWAIGDSILTLPMIRGIRENFRDATVDVLTRNRVMDLYSSYPVDRLFNLDNKKDFQKLLRLWRSYDVVIDGEPYLNISAVLAFFLGKERIGFSRQGRSKLYTQTVGFRKDQHMVQNYLDMLNVTGVDFKVDHLEKISSGDSVALTVNRFLGSQKTRRFLVGITPGVAETAKNRMWFEERFSEVADRIIRELDAEVVFIDSRENEKIVEQIVGGMKEVPINSSGLFSLKEVFYLIGQCDVYISNDTGPMHIAAAQGCKTIGLFGPNIPVLWGPYGKDNISIYKTALPPAIENDKGTFREGNREGYMGPIAVDDVFDAVATCLDKVRTEKE
jgi:heptosyltransferase II